MVNVLNNDYQDEDVVHFIKEEIERIYTQYPRSRASQLTDAQAFGVWFLHQEVGLSYEEANQFILDDSYDFGVDFIWLDKDNHQVLVGQIEYDNSVWKKNPANKQKAIETFKEFQNYLNNSVLPDKLNESSKSLWREARRLVTNEKYKMRYLFVTPKSFTDSQQEQIKLDSGIPNYEFFTYDLLIERGQEFLDGQSGTSSFKLPFNDKPLEIKYDFGSVFVVNVNLRDIHLIVLNHEKNKKLKSLFASNVRSYLNVKKRSKEIADAMRITIKNEPEHFLICNNGITIQCSKLTRNTTHLYLERASISNGCQTAMNIDRFFKENEGERPNASVLVTVIELKQNAPLIAGEIARSRNYQNPVDNRDLMSNNPLLVTLHHRLYADKLSTSDKRYYLLRKQGEKQTILKEEPHARGKLMWIDADFLARCISSVIRQDPYISQQGTNDIFGKFFKQIFPGVYDPSHSRCKYAYWLKEMVSRSYVSKSRWKGINDRLINQQRDFKGLSEWIVASLLANHLKLHFSFNEQMEKRFVESCEHWWINPKKSTEFEDITFDMIDKSFRLLQAVSKSLLGKKLPAARDSYTTYDGLFKGPNYQYILNKIKRGEMATYQYNLKRSMAKFVKYLSTT